MFRWFVKVGEDNYKGQLSMLRILQVLYGFHFFMSRWHILSDVVIVHSVKHLKTLKFIYWWKSRLQDSTNLNKTLFMALARPSSSRCILSDRVVIHGAIYFKTLHFAKWWKSHLQDSTNLNIRNLWQQQERRAAVNT